MVVMSFANLPSLAQPLIPKSLASYEEKLHTLLEELRSAVFAIEEGHTGIEFLPTQAALIRDIGQEAREQLMILEKQPKRIYEDENQKKGVIRRFRAELSRLLLQFERKMSTVTVSPAIDLPAPVVSTAIFSGAAYDQERAAELQNINASLAQIHNMLKEFSKAVTDQGQALVDAEAHVEKVTGHARAGLQEITKTMEKQEGVSLSFKFALALAILILVAGLVAWLVDYVNSDSS